MKLTFNEYIRLYAVIHLERIPNDDSIYKVIRKEGSDVPDLFGIFPTGSCFSGEEYLILGFDWNKYEEHWEYSLRTTNTNALGGAEINPFSKGEEQTRIA